MLHKYGTGSKLEQYSTSFASIGSTNGRYHLTKGPARERTGPLNFQNLAGKVGFNVPDRAELG